MIGIPNAASGTPQKFDQEIENRAGNPLFMIPDNSRDPKEIKTMVESCLEHKLQGIK